MSKAPTRNLIIEQGTDWSERFQITDENDVVISLVGKTFAGQAKRDNNPAILFAFTFVVDTGTNYVTVSVAKATTTALTVGPYEDHPNSKFSYDYEMTEAGVTRRIQQGTCKVYREITTI